MKKRAISMLLCICMMITMLPISMTAAAQADEKEQGYFQAQLLNDAQTIYLAIDEMNLKSGTETITLEGVQTSNWDALFADFVAARDAYMLDHNLFYVDFDKLTLTKTGDTVTIGAGRESTYLQDGFDAENTDTAIAAFQDEVTTIAAMADSEETLQEKVRAVYNAVIEKCTYALEQDAKPANIHYVRNAYGALVAGEAVCSGYARAVKAVLDEMGIKNVLVQGVYDDGTYTGPHMWNAVRMDDHRWYMLDATMEDGLRNSTANADGSESYFREGYFRESYFLVTGLDELMQDYQPNGVISLSAASMEFAYPDLSVKEYEDLSSAFAVVSEAGDYNQMISYKGMGLAAAQSRKDESGADIPLYILASFDGKSWYYYERYIRWTMVIMGGSTDPDQVDITDYDTETYFLNPFGLAYFAVTSVAPAAVYEKGNNDYFTFSAGLESIHEISAVSDAIDFEAVPPYVTKKLAVSDSTNNPYSSRLEQEETYAVTVTYSESLKKANSGLAADIAWVQKVNGGSVADFQWDGDRTVTFTLTTGKGFGSTIPYYFELQNLVGKASGKAPNAIGFSTYNNNTYDCPKVDWDVSKIHSNTPVLVANEDLSQNDWLDADGNSLAHLPKRLSLVATSLENKANESVKQDMINAIEKTLGAEAVQEAQTYDISLSLCNNQVAYITGKPIEVYVPFPTGYSYENYTSGTTAFKAYHFDKDGIPEEITCRVVQGGIIMYCTKFSPFAVVALAEAPSAYTYRIDVTGGSAAIDAETVTEAKKGQTVTITANVPANHRFAGWQIVSGRVTLADAAQSTTFIMPDQAVYIAAVYEKITSIEVNNSNGSSYKTAYLVGDTLDVTGLTILVTTADGVQEPVTVTADMVSGFDSTSAAASQTLTITYYGVTTTYTVSIAEHISISSVAVSPDAPQVQKGQTQQFRAVVQGTGDFDSTVTWTVEGGVSGTTISTDGLLTVAENETATTLIVKAIANGDADKYAAVSVTVTAAPVTRYTVTVTDGNGSGEYEAGVDVTIVADAPAAGKRFKEWTGTEGLEFLQGTTSTNATAVFHMPARAVTVAAVYEDMPVVTYTITVTNDGHGSACANVTSAEAGTEITLTAVPDAGYRFRVWQVLRGGDVLVEDTKAVTTFTMPARDVELRAVFEQLPSTDCPEWYYDVMMLHSRQFTIRATATEGGMVTPAGAHKVYYDRAFTCEIVPLDGYEIVSVVVDGRDLGAITEYTFSHVRENHMLHAVFAEMPQQLPFADVSEADWFCEDVRFVYDTGLMIGTDLRLELFSPQGKLDRATIVTILWRLAGSPIVTLEAAFTDLPEDWYTAAMKWAICEGIILGYGDETCRPMAEVTHEQVMAILRRFMSTRGYAAAPNALSVESLYSQWAEQDVLWAAANHLTDGFGTDISDLTRTADRAEIAAYIHRLCQWMEK